ncbi:MAG: substrate-binding domain-containing protein [Phycisphaeraceae bacterium]
MATDRNQAPKVAVLVDTSTGWGRRMISGVTGYAHKRGPWHVWVEPRGRSEHLTLPPDWNGDGIIARISTARMADALDQLGVPVVNVSGIEIKGRAYPTVTTDSLATAKLTAEHFLDRGFKHYAYLGPMKHSYVRGHYESLGKVLQDAGVDNPFAVFDYKYESVSNRGWHDQYKKLSDWLIKLPKPLAIIAWATTGAPHVLDICRDAGIATPDDVAVLASDEDALLCEATSPPLSAVLIASRQIGYRAAERLDAMMRGGVDSGGTEHFSPVEIITRGSTETFAIEDKELLSAVLYMRQNAFGPLTVQEIADAVPMTRRSLERKFQSNYGRTPLTELHRLRLARAKQLLAQTDQPIAQVAEACGFGTPEYLATRFRVEVGTTPLRFRSISRGR